MSENEKKELLENVKKELKDLKNYNIKLND